jgi:tetratricopeptide (TPR) repeat protein
MEAGAGHQFSGRGLAIPEAIHRETEGNPFFIAEVIRHMVETGKFFRREGVWVYDAASAAELGLPEGVRDVISRRLARLSENANQVLARASVLGREFEFDVLATMVGGEDETLAGVEEAVERGLLIESRERRVVSYAFTHALVRQTLYEEMSMPRKQKLHLRAGEAIEAVHQRDISPHAAALAVHYRTAGAAADVEKAIDYSIQAGRAAYATSAFEEAVAHFEAALQLIEEEGIAGGDRKGQVLEQLGDLMHVTGTDRPKGIHYLERALSVYEEQGRSDRAILIQSRLGRAYSSFPATMNIPRALEHYRKAEALVSGLPDSVPLGYLYVGIAAADLWGSRVDDGVEAAERAMSIAEATGNEALWANAATMKGWFLGETNRLGEGLQLVEEAWQTADRIGHVLGAFFAAWTLMALLFYGWRPKDSLAMIQRELASGRLNQIPDLHNFLLDYSASLGLAFGDSESARVFTREHPEMPRTGSDTVFRLLMNDGDWEGAALDLERDWTRYRAAGVDLLAWTGLGWLVFLRQLMGDVDGARQALNEAFEITRDMNSRFARNWLGYMQARHELDVGEAGRALELIVEIRRDLNLVEWGGFAGRLQEIEAEILLVRGDDQQARRLFDAAVAASEERPHLVFDAEFRYRWGRALVVRGDGDGARQHFDAAIEIYRRFGFGQRWVDRAEAARGT